MDRSRGAWQIRQTDRLSERDSRREEEGKAGTLCKRLWKETTNISENQFKRTEQEQARKLNIVVSLHCIFDNT